MWRSRVACTRSRMTRDRCHSWRTQACSTDHRRPCKRGSPSVSGAALVESERVIILSFSSSVVLEIGNCARAAVSDPPLGRFRHTPARALLQVLENCCAAAGRVSSAAAITARGHRSLPVLALVSIRQQKRAAPVGSPSVDRSSHALYQGIDLSARESVPRCANARAATSGVR
jgi:hypothetical protein